MAKAAGVSYTSVRQSPRCRGEPAPRRHGPREREARLRRSEERFRRLAEIGMVGVIFFNAEGRITDAMRLSCACPALLARIWKQACCGGDELTPPEWMPRTVGALKAEVHWPGHALREGGRRSRGGGRATARTRLPSAGGGRRPGGATPAGRRRAGRHAGHGRWAAERNKRAAGRRSQPAGRATSLVRQRSARPLRLLRRAAQLAGFEWVPAGSATYLVQLPQAAEPEESSHGLGLVRDRDAVLLPTTASDSPLDTTCGIMRVTSGKSQVREIRPPGSVRAKPNGRATRPRPFGLWPVMVIWASPRRARKPRAIHLSAFDRRRCGLRQAPCWPAASSRSPSYSDIR